MMLSTYAYYQDLTGEGHTFWAPVWEIAVDRERRSKTWHGQWLQFPESTLITALIIEGRNIKDLPYGNYICRNSIETYEKDPVMYQVLSEEAMESFNVFVKDPKKWNGIKKDEPKFPLQKTIVEAEKRRKKVGSYLAETPGEPEKSQS